MAFLDLVSELSGLLPGLSPELAEKHVNRAYEYILRSRLWSFLVTYGAVVCPTQITTGTADITQYSSDVPMSVAASAALLAQAQNTTQPGLTNLQIRFGPTSPIAGQIYNILAVDVTDPTALVLTLDRMVLEASSATSGYQVYRCYITPPVDDFKAWLSFVDMANSIAFTDKGGRTQFTSVDFDRRDPQRQAQGLAYFLGSYAGNRVIDPIEGTVAPNPNVDAATPIYELWPHPVQGQTFYVRVRRKGELFVDPTDTQPEVISDSLILHRALAAHSYPFAQANLAHYPTFKGVNWAQLIATRHALFQDELQKAKLQDNEAQEQDVIRRGHGLRGGPGQGQVPFPIDSNFIQGHLLNF